jgi:hypothetical protein
LKVFIDKLNFILLSFNISNRTEELMLHYVFDIILSHNGLIHLEYKYHI